MKAFVVETSALLRLFVPDGPIPAGLEEAMELVSRGAASVFVPELLLAEAAQVLHKKVRAAFLTESEADEILAAIVELPLEVIGHREVLAGAVAAARRHALTVYDGIFLALAAARGGELLTDDSALAAAWRARLDPSATGSSSRSGSRSRKRPPRGRRTPSR